MKNAKLYELRYLYLSTSTACFENTLLRGAALEKLIEARDFSECFRFVCDAFARRGEGVRRGEDEYEKALTDELARAYDETEALLRAADGETRLLFPLRYAYDCLNLKSCIKCEALSVSPDGMLTPCGCVPEQEVPQLVRLRDFSPFTPHMAQAAKDAVDRLSASGDPQVVDALLDRAAFADMRKTADDIGLPYLSALCAKKADLLNITAFLRCVRFEAGGRLFGELFLPGGTLPEAFFADCRKGGAEALFSALGATVDYGEIGMFAEKTGVSFSDVEKTCDELYLAAALGARRVSFGPEKALCYLIEKENEIRNVRIVLAGKKAALSKDAIRDRLREAPLS